MKNISLWFEQSQQWAILPAVDLKMIAATGLPTVAAVKKIQNPDELIRVSLAWKQYAATHPAWLPACHDLLLYLKAFPASAAVYRHAITALQDVQQQVFAVMNRKNQALQHKLSGTGIVHTPLNCSYSYELASWLAKRFPDDVSLGGSDATPEEVIAVFRILMPVITFEKVTQGALGLSARIRAIAGIQHPGGQLQWLLALFAAAALDGMVKESLYQSLRIFIVWKTHKAAFSRTGLCLPVAKTYYVKKQIAPADLQQLTGAPVKKIQVPRTFKNTIIDTVRAALAFYCRETDPFTYADPAETELFEMGKGLQIALVGMRKERRLSLESYIGYMAFSNGVPVAYGGGWIWGHRCKIGLNIFPPFRKAASDHVFCQVMRVYRQYYHVHHFVVRPYQFGKGNPEGIRSGAFWFYYRLGFRPAVEQLKVMAAQEWEKVSSVKHHRTAVSLLKRFTAADLVCTTGMQSVPSFDAALLSSGISRQINMEYAGCPRKALTHAMRAMKKVFPASIIFSSEFPETVRNNFLLLAGFIPGIAQWPDKDKQALVNLFLLKVTGKERVYIQKLQAHRILWHALGQQSGIKT